MQEIRDNISGQDSYDKIKKFLIFTLVIVVLLILVFIVYYFLKMPGGEIEVNEDNFGQISSSEVRNCLDKNLLDENCALIFSHPDILELCKKVGDDCYYRLALMNHLREYCNNIKNKQTKISCMREVIPLSINNLGVNNE